MLVYAATRAVAIKSRARIIRPRLVPMQMETRMGYWQRNCHSERLIIRAYYKVFMRTCTSIEGHRKKCIFVWLHENYKRSCVRYKEFEICMSSELDGN